MHKNHFLHITFIIVALLLIFFNPLLWKFLKNGEMVKKSTDRYFISNVQPAIEAQYDIHAGNEVLQINDQKVSYEDALEILYTPILSDTEMRTYTITVDNGDIVTHELPFSRSYVGTPRAGLDITPYYWEKTSRASVLVLHLRNVLTGQNFEPYSDRSKTNGQTINLLGLILLLGVGAHAGYSVIRGKNFNGKK